MSKELDFSIQVSINYELPKKVYAFAIYNPNLELRDIYENYNPRFFYSETKELLEKELPEGFTFYQSLGEINVIETKPNKLKKIC